MFERIYWQREERQHAYDRAQIIKEREYVFSGEEFANKYWLKRFCPNAYLFYSASRLIKNHGLRFLDKIYYEDNEFYCKIMAKAQRTMYIPQKLYSIRPLRYLSNNRLNPENK